RKKPTLNVLTLAKKSESLFALCHAHQVTFLVKPRIKQLIQFKCITERFQTEHQILQTRVPSLHQMSFCLAELHLWSSRSTLHVKDTDIGTYQFYDKGEPGESALTAHHYFSEKQQFLESRGYPWALKNRRPEKLRDSLKELEDLLQTVPCVCVRWRTKQCCQLLLSSGELVTLSVVGAQLERVFIDRALLGRLPADTISHAVITDKLLLLTFVEKSQVCLVHMARKSQGSPEPSRRVEKLSPSELKISSVALPGGAGRRPGRRVGLNRSQDVAVCWWPAPRNEEARPWSPLPSEAERANLVLLSCSDPPGLKVLSCVRTQGDPLDCTFSLTQPYQLLTVEVPAAAPVEPDATVTALSSTYESARGRLQCLSVERLPLPCRPISCSRDPSETRLLLGLSDSSLVLHDWDRGLSLRAQCPMLPSLCAWHPAGALLVVGGDQGELQCFDLGLAPLPLRLLAEELPQPPGPTLQLCRHLRAPGGLAALQWAASQWGGQVAGEGGLEVHDLLLLSFHGGPVAALRLKLGALTGGQLGPAELVHQRVRHGQVGEALGILAALDWSVTGGECYRALSAVAEHLLRLPLNAEREAQLEAALGVFYAPSRPISDTVVLEFREPISRYARRFFHHLLRHQRFEKAFLLAVDIGAKDLFMDIHYVAHDKGELVLADVAKKKANEIDAESLTSGWEGQRSVFGDRNTVSPAALETAGQTGRQQDRGTERKLSIEGRGHGLTRRVSQDKPPSSGTGGWSKVNKELEEVFAGDQTWPWTQTEINLVDRNDQGAEDTGTLKVIHFGLV
ncbi:WD repeat-containing and planar cell polarity effector protein fritz homolog, partial [Clupea harengus]|uniref:WD repeat-containing and planar cell polarity effector protein fritz homolog n=1 Tax=Clupea harengus TaxID=7950 RepID=A0A6P8G3M1_CLUHA